MDPARMEPYNGPVPAVVHLHGGDVPSEFDGGPDAWFTPNGLKGQAYRTLFPAPANAAVYRYFNNQEPATVWYHDHVLGGTRLNVYAGLAGYYWIRDWRIPLKNPSGMERTDLPGGPLDAFVLDTSNPAQPRKIKAEIEFAIQDRMFDTNGQLFFPDMGETSVHPFWNPEFFGDVILVNGKPWPFFNVEPRRYRIHFLNGSNARFYRMWLENAATGAPGPVFWQIATDGGFLDRPVQINPFDPVNPQRLLMGPGERCDIIIDFSKFAGQTLTLRNNAPAPFPDGDAVEPGTTGQIMQFRVGKRISSPLGIDPSLNPACNPSLRSPLPRLSLCNVTERRQLTLNEALSD
jgi:FtsP/CotA-like multicopper oxidase with cupredoxin domain